MGETAGDLAIVMAARSSLRDSPVPQLLIVFGELGLAGEIRPVPFGEERLREAAKHGFKLAVVPEANVPKRPLEGMTVHGVDAVESGPWMRSEFSAAVCAPS